MGHLIADYLPEDDFDLCIEGRNDFLVQDKRGRLYFAYQVVNILF